MSKYLAKLHKPDSNINKYDDEPFMKNPLLKFRISEVKEQRHYAFLKKKAAEEKIKLCRNRSECLEDVISLPKSIYINRLHRYGSEVPIPKMLNKTEKKILSYIPERFKNQYSTIISSHIKEVRDEFDKIIKQYSLQKILKPLNSSNVLKRDKFSLKIKGRTENYQKYLQNRKRLKKKLLITYPFIKSIIHYSNTDFPQILNDLSNYRQSDEFILEEFESKFRKDLLANSSFLKKVWYPKIMKIIVKHYKKRTVPKTMFPQVLLCAAALINRQLTELKTRTIDHLCDIISDHTKIPTLKVNMISEQIIDLYPNLEKIFKVYHNMVNEICSIGKDLEALEYHIDSQFFKTKEDYLKIDMGEIFTQELHMKLDGVLLCAYSPLTVYLTSFQNEFQYLSNSSDTQRTLAEFLAGPQKTFEDYLEKVDEVKFYIEKIKRTIQREFFDMVTVNQYEAIQSLTQTGQLFINQITDKILFTHRRMKESICETFENIKAKAMEIPKSTEQLIESGDYMVQVKTKKRFELQDQVKECLRIAGILIEYRELPMDHLQLQIEAINWIYNIRDVFQLNAALHEQYKAQFEEHLQNVAKKLTVEIADVLPGLSIIDDMSCIDKLPEYSILLSNLIDKLHVFDDHVSWINKEEKLFKFPRSKYDDLDVIKQFVIPFAALLKLCIEWMRFYNVWMDGPFEYLEPTFVEKMTENYLKEFITTQKYYRNRIKADLIGTPVCKFRGQTEDPDPEKHPVPLRLCWKMITRIKDFRIGVQMVNIMCNPALRERHWNEMTEIAGFDLTPNAGTTLRKFINYKLDEKLPSFEIISVGANKELQLQQNLADMINEWDNVEFSIAPFKDTFRNIIVGLDDIQALLDEHLLKTLSMRGSAFVKPCQKEVRAWYDKLVRVNKVIDQWGKVQSNWLYLLPIFSSKDIVDQMPEEGKLFQRVDVIYKRYMDLISLKPEVIETASSAGFLEAVEQANDMLEDISNGVNKYLEKKRLFFPRFFFLSNEEMLEILSETKDPLRVQPHLQKCFEGIYRLKFDENLDIVSMQSEEDEVLEFQTKISPAEARGSVEKWLFRVEEEMLKAVQYKMSESCVDYKESPRIEWALNWPQMVVLCVSQVFWASQVHDSLTVRHQAQIQLFFDQVKNDLNDIVNLIRSQSISNLNRITIKSLIVIDVHAKDIVENLIINKIQSENDFQWLSQLRYYRIDGKTEIRIINASVPYANEYLGNSDRLVITPLTDRCYRTLIGAYQLHLNGAPEGPAGTGKTETTKDLAKALAVQCKVFNCSDGLDYIAMGKFFKGLASCGAWACFDEFNRIESEVLSVVAQQILCIVQSIRAGHTKFMFEGTELSLNPACYVCITMNPGYAGRSELPDNLKVLFRTVAMMVPDYAMIGEISLYSYGFLKARSLAVKIVTTYRLCSEQLSSQNHYDYGMRAVKTVLQACGNIKKTLPDLDEDILLLRSLLDVNLPKFVPFDIPLFKGIVSDIFPGVQLPENDYELFTNAFMEACKKTNIQPTDSLLEKVIQTYEMMIVRHGFMLVGDPFAGKSVTLKILTIILSQLKLTCDNNYYQSVQMQVLNPKSVTMDQLYGKFDPISYEWTDGIATMLYRNFVIDKNLNRKWLIFDGPVDAVWIENMNTVLDDNKKLCLNSGEVITMTNKMTMIFEVMDLSQASPATVSRCGMIYMESRTLGWNTFALSWIEKCNPLWSKGNEKLLLGLLNLFIPDCLTFVRRNCNQLLNPGEINLVMCTLNLFEMILNDAFEDNAEDYLKNYATWFQAAIIFSVVWGIGGILDEVSREKFDECCRELCRNDENASTENILKIELSLPSEELLFDYVYIFKQRGSWKYWPDFLRRLEPEMGPLGMQVPTIDTARYMYIFDLHVKYKKPFLLTGPTGTGKSFYIQNAIMSKLSPEKYIPAFVTLTVMITANQTQDLIISKLIKRKKGIYGPPAGKTNIIFVDDMNMPTKEIYGAQPPIELLRQYFDYGYWYDLKTNEKIYLCDIVLVSACGLIGGSRQDVYPRFLRHFNIFSINSFSEETMSKIFQTLLLTNYKQRGHVSDVINPVIQIVSATLHVYKLVCQGLKPTPARSHYIFNLRDIARVICGCGLLKKDSVENKRTFAKIWIHETMRIFYDRLVDDVDRNWMYSKMDETAEDFFKDKIEVLLEDLKTESGKVTIDCLGKLMFGSYLDLNSDLDDRKYEEITNLNTLQNIALTSLEEYNSRQKTRMDIVFFNYALEHLNKICRILSMPAGSNLLIGMGGSGRQSLTRLAANICGLTLFQPEISKNYNIMDWRNDLKKVLKEAGGVGKDTVFLLNETQIKMEVFLQDIDCLLNLGEVPNIFPIDEKQEILEMVRLGAQGGNRNIDISPLQVFSFFSNRCKQKLHIVMAFSPIGQSFRSRIRLYPSLINCCTIDWYEPWPKEALKLVAKKYMADMDLFTEIKEAAGNACQYFHIKASNLCKEFISQTGRICYVTSASYMELLRSFQKLTHIKQNDIIEAKKRYIGGLATLEQASNAVAIMQIELNELQPKLLVMAENSLQMTIQIEKKTVEASEATEHVKRDEIIANAQAAAAQELKDECEKDLAQAIPVLEEAIQALNTLKPADITLVKSMKNPPEVVKLVMAAVCVIKGVPADRINDPATGRKILDYWGPSKRILGDMGFLQALKDFDKDNISPDIMKKIRKDYIPHKDFQPRIVAKASSAAEGLCKWLIAMDLYDSVAKVVAPKKARLEAAEKEYAETMQILNEKRLMAEELERKVAILNAELAEANLQKQRVEAEVAMCKNKLERAETLISGLGGEKSRWITAAEILQTLYDNLAGDILISCGIIAYLSSFTITYRSKCVQDWHKFCIDAQIPCSDHYNFVDVLGSEIKVQNWNLASLPRDIFSAENAIIMDSSSRYSLFIDPQRQANSWIRLMEKQNRLEIVKFTQVDYMKIIETCIELGHPCLIENINEDLDVALDPILFKNVYLYGGIEYINLGENTIAFSPKFRLYLTSNARNPHYLPEIFNKVTVINFALTLQGLEDQLLGIVVAKERPDLQELRQNLIISNAQNKQMLKEVEDNILKTLSSCKGDILEDESAIKILDNSKILADDIQAKQASSLETEKKIEEFRQSYRSVAIHSATLYYCITDLPNIDPMYQFSLKWYINLYVYSIENANKSKNLYRRLKFLMDAVTVNLYNSVCRSIFEKDKLLFSFLLTIKIMISCNQIDPNLFLFLVNGGSNMDKDLLKAKPEIDWLTDKIWESINQLEQLMEFQGFVESFLDNLNEWKSYYDAPDPHLCKTPGIWDGNTNRFEKLLLLRSFRPDKTADAIYQFVSSEMGSVYVMPPPFDISKSYKDSNCLVPIIFILTPDADPTGSLLLFAEKMGKDEQFKSISLGQGQGPIAERLIAKAQEDGSWICLQNCHLAGSWMPTLEQIWENMDIHNTATTFRLWLTSYPSYVFPTSLLQNGIKLTNEPPTGLKQNLLRSYNSEPMSVENFYKGCPGKDKAFTKLLYGICFFHAVVQERRKFGALGWNIPYGFNESDFQISVQQLQMFLNQYDEVPYVAISYLTGECNYGGRITDIWDRRAIVTILQDYINAGVVDDVTYKFSNVDDDAYSVPRKFEHRDVLRHIEEVIPLVPSTEIYGLHANAGIVRNLITSTLLIESLMLISGQVSIGADEDTEKHLITMVQSFEKKLPDNFDIELVMENYPIDYKESMNTVLIQEMERFNKLLTEIRKSCEDLQDGIKGNIVMTPELEEIAKSLTFQKIPDRWKKKSYPSLKSVASYIYDFLSRLEWFGRWYHNGTPNKFWISGFFFTQAFLTGSLQNFARKYKLSIDTLTFDFKVLSNIEAKSISSPVDGIYVYGPYLEGAKWSNDHSRLDEQDFKVLIAAIPPVHLIPIISTSLVEGTRYKCPMYKTAERRGILSTTGHSTNYVLTFLLETQKPATHWIKRSAALICQTSD